MSKFFARLAVGCAASSAVVRLPSAHPDETRFLNASGFLCGLTTLASVWSLGSASVVRAADVPTVYESLSGSFFNIYTSSQGPVVCYPSANGSLSTLNLNTKAKGTVKPDCTKPPAGMRQEDFDIVGPQETYTPGGPGTFLDGYIVLAVDASNCAAGRNRYNYVDVKTGQTTSFYMVGQLEKPASAPATVNRCDAPAENWTGPKQISFEQAPFQILSHNQQGAERGMLALDDLLMKMRTFPKPGEIIKFNKPGKVFKYRT